MGVRSYNPTRLIETDRVAIFNIDDVRLLRFHLSAADETMITTSANSGDKLKLKANSVNPYPYILLRGNSDVEIFSRYDCLFYSDGIHIGTLERGGGGAGGVLALKETTTPTAVGGWGRIYTKADNHLYWQSGAGVEYDLGGA